MQAPAAEATREKQKQQGLRTRKGVDERGAGSAAASQGDLREEKVARTGGEDQGRMAEQEEQGTVGERKEKSEKMNIGKF